MQGREVIMKKPFSIPPLGQSALVRTMRQSPSVLQVSLFLGLICITFFSGVGEAHGLLDKPPTDTDKPTNPPNTHVPTYKTVAPTDPPAATNTPVLPTDPPIASNTPIASTNTPYPTNTSIIRTNTPIPSATGVQSPIPTVTTPCTYGLTPTATGIPLPTCTPTPTPTGTEAPTDTALPGGPTSTPRPIKTRTPTNTAGVMPDPAASVTAADPDLGITPTPSDNPQGASGPLATASITPTGGDSYIPWPGTGAGSNPNPGANGIPFLLFIAALMTGGGIFFAFRLRGPREVFSAALADEGSAALAIHPATVGASGFAAWLAGQVPMLTQGEQVVLSKVRNGIGSALRLVGGVSDLNKISEIGTQEFLQLTARSPFPAVAIRGSGFAGG
jgi:hypothetical protein